MTAVTAKKAAGATCHSHVGKTQTEFIHTDIAGRVGESFAQVLFSLEMENKTEEFFLREGKARMGIGILLL